jgi:putative redox protein
VSDAYWVELTTVDGGPTALGSAGPVTVVVDRPVGAGGRGRGFNGGQLMYLAVAACISNDLYREAATAGIQLTRVAITVDGDFPGRGSVSSPIAVDVELEGNASSQALEQLLDEVDRVAEIPASIRHGTPVSIRSRRVKAPAEAVG